MRLKVQVRVARTNEAVYSKAPPERKKEEDIRNMSHEE